MKTIKNNGNIPYYKQEKGKKIKSNINNNQYNNLYENHFLNDENIRIYITNQSNNYQNQYKNKKNYNSNTKRKSKNNSKIFYDYEEESSHNKDSSSRKEKQYYTNNNSINRAHNYNNNSFIENLGKLQVMNSGLNDKLGDIQKTIKTTSNRKAINLKKNFEQSIQNKSNENINEYNNLVLKEIVVKNKEKENENDINKNCNEIPKDNSIDNEQKSNKELNSININRNYDFDDDNKIINKKSNTTGKNNKSKNKNARNKIDFNAFINSLKSENTSSPKKNITYVIDENGKNEINIRGKKNKKNLSKIKLKELTKEQENKLKIFSEKNKNKNDYININDLINDLYEYKVKYFEIKKNLDSNKELKEKEFDENLKKLKSENEYLNKQKHFLINELTKSIYCNEKLKQRYKNELERIDAYVNEINFDIKEKKV